MACHRRGVVAVLFALLLPVFIGLVALSVDLGVIVLARAQLQTVADAAALAGAQQLASERRIRTTVTDLTPEVQAATNQAVTIGQRNAVLGQAAVITSGDMVIGSLNIDPNNPQYNPQAIPQSTPDPTGSQLNFNSVQVAAHGMVPALAFFSKLWGFPGSSVQFVSTATAQPYAVKGYQSVANLNANLLPIVLDKDTYTSMILGTQATDQYTYNPTTKTVTSGPDGIMESQLYPVGSGSPGNWGTVKIGVEDNGTSTLRDQISNGITPQQLDYYQNSTFCLTGLTPPSIVFKGNPGISAGIKDNLSGIIGKPVMMPVYDSSGGKGNNAWYRIVMFAGVRILAVNFQGNPKYVIVQPALVNDRTAIPDKPLTTWTSGGLIRIHLTR